LKKKKNVRMEYFFKFQFVQTNKQTNKEEEEEEMCKVLGLFTP